MYGINISRVTFKCLKIALKIYFRKVLCLNILSEIFFIFQLKFYLIGCTYFAKVSNFLVDFIQIMSVPTYFSQIEVKSYR